MSIITTKLNRFKTFKELQPGDNFYCATIKNPNSAKECCVIDNIPDKYTTNCFRIDYFPTARIGIQCCLHIPIIAINSNKFENDVLIFTTYNPV